MRSRNQATICQHTATILLLLLALAGRAAADDCTAWQGLGWEPNGGIQALIEYDGELIVAGGFTEIDGQPVNRIARWNGASWASLADGIGGQFSWVSALAEYEGELIAAGRFFFIGENAQHLFNIARWDGTSWQPLGGGLGGGEVRALAVYEDHLIAAGRIEEADEQPVANIARWDGSSWQSLGDGLPSSLVNALIVHDGELFAGGFFLDAPNLARWDGASWHYVEGGISGIVDALAVYNGELIAGGASWLPGGEFGHNILRWDGASWHALHDGIQDAQVLSMKVVGDDLIVGGWFTLAAGTAANNIARWDGLSWRPLGGGITGFVRAVAKYNNELIIAGSLSSLDPLGGRNIAVWTVLPEGHPQCAPPVVVCASWTDLDGGVDSMVRTLAVYDGDLIAAGLFKTAGGKMANLIARWSGSQWDSLGIGSPVGVGAALVVHNGYLYVGGGLGLARWDGDSWLFLDDTEVMALAVFNGDLVASTWHVFRDDFEQGLPPGRVSKWDGSTWQPMGLGIDQQALALMEFDGDLIAAGSFTKVDGSPISSIARWDGDAWHPMGAGMDFTVNTLAVYEGNLIAGGGFATVDAQPIRFVASWDGSSWQPLGQGVLGDVFALTISRDELIAGGTFTVAGGLPARRVARWNGSFWQSVGGGIDGQVVALIDYEGDLVAGGSFKSAGGIPVNHIARSYGHVHTAGVGETFTHNVTVNQQDGHLIEVSAVGLPSGATVTPSSGYAPVEFTIEWTPTFSDVGEHNVTLLFTDGSTGGEASCSLKILVEGSAVPPVAVCHAYAADGVPVEGGSDITLECHSPYGREVTLDATGSYSDDPDAVLSYRWDVSDVDVILDDPDSAIATGMFPLGITMATLTVTDANTGEFSTCDVIITVQDTTPPQVMVTTDIAVLWPPNKQMHEVEIRIVGTDECAHPEDIIPIIVTVHSSEPDDTADGAHLGDVDGEDGHTSPRLYTAADFTFDASHQRWVATIQLRAERLGSGPGRSYTIDVTAMDPSSNIGTSSCVVVVPKGKGGPNN